MSSNARERVLRWALVVGTAAAAGGVAGCAQPGLPPAPAPAPPVAAAPPAEPPGTGIAVLLLHRTDLHLTPAQVDRLEALGRDLEAANAPLAAKLPHQRPRPPAGSPPTSGSGGGVGRGSGGGGGTPGGAGGTPGGGGGMAGGGGGGMRGGGGGGGMRMGGGGMRGGGGGMRGAGGGMRGAGGGGRGGRGGAGRTGSGTPPADRTADDPRADAEAVNVHDRMMENHAATLRRAFDLLAPDQRPRARELLDDYGYDAPADPDAPHPTAGAPPP
jgi:hypothetical protein